MTLDEIETWARRMGVLGLAELEVSQGDARLVLRRDGGARVAEVAAPVPGVLRAPHFGYLRLVHPQRSLPEVAVGAAVKEGQIVAYVEAGAVLHPVVSDHAGRLAEWLAEDGALVGYGEGLGTVTP